MLLLLVVSWHRCVDNTWLTIDVLDCIWILFFPLLKSLRRFSTNSRATVRSLAIFLPPGNCLLLVNNFLESVWKNCFDWPWVSSDFFAKSKGFNNFVGGYRIQLIHKVLYGSQVLLLPQLCDHRVHLLNAKKKEIVLTPLSFLLSSNDVLTIEFHLRFELSKPLILLFLCWFHFIKFLAINSNFSPHLSYILAQFLNGRFDWI